jgi:hypothetical protein
VKDNGNPLIPYFPTEATAGASTAAAVCLSLFATSWEKNFLAVCCLAGPCRKEAYLVIILK